MNYHFEFDTPDKFKIGQTKITIEIKYLERIMKDWFIEMLDAREPKQRPPDPFGKPLLTISDIANKFSVSKTTVHNWRRRKIIIGRTVGKNRYFTEDEVQAALDWQTWKGNIPGFDL